MTVSIPNHEYVRATDKSGSWECYCGEPKDHPVHASIVANCQSEFEKGFEAGCAFAVDTYQHGEVRELLRRAVGCIKVNEQGEPLERCVPWTLDWFEPARVILGLKKGETFIE